MRVLHIYKDFQPYGGGGVARHIHGLALEQVKLGFSVRVAAPDAANDEFPYEVMDLKSLSLWRVIRNVDIVHLHGARSFLSLQSFLLAFLFRLKIIYTPHCYYQSVGKLGNLLKLVWDYTAEYSILKLSSTVILLNEHWLSYLQTKGLSPRASAVIPNCVNEGELLRAASRRDTGLPQSLKGLKIVYLGRLDRVKRIDDLIKAVALLAGRDIELDIIGSGPEKAHLSSLVCDLGLEDQITFHGFLPDDEAYALCLSCDVFVLPSESEGMPTVLIEMVLLGIPILCTSIDGNLAITEAIGADGIFAVGDISHLAVLLSTAESHQLTELQIRETRSQFTWEARALDVAKLYRD